MRKFFFFYVLLLTFAFQRAAAQLKETFSLGNIIENPVWVGDTAGFMVNAAGQLQSNSTLPNHTFTISTKNRLALEVEWEFWVRLAFNPSSANYVDVFLISLEADLASTSNTGYFVRLGGTADEISLLRLDRGGSMVKVIDGQDGTLNTSNNIFKVKVIRDAQHNWTLFRDLHGQGNNYQREGSVVDSTYQQSEWFGILIKQSTSSFFQKHYFDDISIQPYARDTLAPQIDSLIVTSAHSLDIYFNEPVHKTTGAELTNYSVGQGIGTPVQVLIEPANPALVHVTFGTSFENRVPYELLIKDVQDLWGNMLKEARHSFVFSTPLRYDILITEIFADPNPQVGLPNQKYLELHNSSAYPVHLGGWRLLEGDNRSILPAFTIQPKEYVILTATSSASAFTDYGRVIGVPGFPNLPVAGGTVILESATGEVVHAVLYSSEMHANEVKKAGGWSLEMKDVQRGCNGNNNWASSQHASGGTPGTANSIATTVDPVNPKLKHAYFDNDRLTVVFDATLDSMPAASPQNFHISSSAVISVEVVRPFFRELKLELANEPQAGDLLQLEVKDIAGCNGMQSRLEKTVFGKMTKADSSQVVINEILFNPPSGGEDYVELYNRSSSIFNLRDFYLANRNSRGEPGSITKITEETIPFFPQQYFLLTVNKAMVLRNYVTENEDAFIEMKSFPSYPNTSGTVLLLNEAGTVIDEVNYHEKWHHALVKNPAGVALERIDAHASSIATNFHSASASAGYGTPGYKNSQQRPAEVFKGQIKVEPDIFSPDGDGIDDFVRIHYNFPVAGYTANIKIFDATGRIVRYLEKTSLTGTSGYFKWDGLDDRNRQLPQGVYIIYTHVFLLNGSSNTFKNTVVLGRRIP